MKNILRVLLIAFVFSFTENLYAQNGVTYSIAFGDGAMSSGSPLSGSGGGRGMSPSSSASGNGGYSRSQYIPVSPQVLDGITGRILKMRDNIILDLIAFDDNSEKVIKTVEKMRIDSASASKYPKAVSSFKMAMKGFKDLEPLSKEIHDTFTQGGEISTIKSKTQADLAQQNEIIKISNRNVKRGEVIIELGTNRNKIISDAAYASLKDNSLTAEDLKQLKKNKADIVFAQSQINKLTKNKADLLEQSSAVRSEALQIAGLIALSMKSSGKIMATYAGALSENKVLAGTIDVAQTFFEKAVDEKYVNNKSYEASFKEAFGAAYLKALIVASSSDKFPLDDLLVLPSKINELVDDTKAWEELNENTTKARAKVNEQLQIIDKSISINQKILDKSNISTKTLLLKESKIYIETPDAELPKLN